MLLCILSFFFLPHPGAGDSLFYLTRSSVAKIFLPHPSSPARRGSTSPPKSSPPQEGGLKAWPAGPVLANKLSPLRGCS